MTGAVAGIRPATLPWAVAGIDPEVVLAEAGRRFPEVMAWFGEFTGSWWALVGESLLEARTPRGFIEVIGTAVESCRIGRQGPSRPTTTVAVEADTADDLLASERRELPPATYRPKHASGAHRGLARRPRARREDRGLLRRFFGGRAVGGTALGSAKAGRLRSA